MSDEWKAATCLLTVLFNWFVVLAAGQHSSVLNFSW